MNVKMNKLALAVVAMVMAGAAMAATETDNLAVSATVVNACAIGPGTLAFGTLALGIAANGTVSTSDATADTGTTISIVCTNGASAEITAGLGLHAAGSVRKMASGSDLLTYELYTSSARDTILDSTTGLIAYTGTGSATTNKSVYGRILAADITSAVKGSYADTVAMTITYTP